MLHFKEGVLPVFTSHLAGQRKVHEIICPVGHWPTMEDFKVAVETLNGAGLVSLTSLFTNSKRSCNAKGLGRPRGEPTAG